MKTVRKRSEHSGRMYARYRNGYWPRYRRQRKQRFQRAIGTLRSRLERCPDPYPVKRERTVGRPPMPPKTILIAIMLKVMLDLSYLDTQSFLRWSTNDGVLMDVPAASTLQEHMADMPLEYLHAMLVECSSALEGQGTTGLMDATGLSAEQCAKWGPARCSSRKAERMFVKVHLAVDLGSRAAVVRIASKGRKGDHAFGLRMLAHLGRSMRAKGFERVLGGSGYLSRVMATSVEELGGEPVIKIRSNITARAGTHPAFRRMVRRQKERLEEFDAIYCCYRVVIEGVISALKRLFGRTVASRRRNDQDVEVLCRLMLWNYGRIDLA